MIATATKKCGRKPRAETLPCVRCGNLGGWANRKCGQVSPQRTDATRFGVNGKVCKACYVTLGRKAKNGKPGQAKPVRVVLPCARCGTPDGAIRRSTGCVTPSRYDATCFGINGRVCIACWNVLKNANPFVDQNCRTVKTARKPVAKRAEPSADPAAPAATPCADCGTTAGRIPAGCKAPTRHPGEPVGRRGLLCTRCYNRAYERKRAAEARALAEEVGDSMDLYRRVRLEKFTAFGFSLPVLTPPFTRDDLTPRAESRLLIREARREGRL